MTETEAWTLFFVLLPAFGAVLGAILIYAQAKKDRNRYRFYEFRDDLIYLVANRKLSEDDYLFKEFYTMVNKVVNRTDKITFSNLVKSIRNDFAEKESADRLRDAIRAADPEVRDVIYNYLCAIVNTLFSNSLVFKVLVFVFGLSHWLRDLGRVIAKQLPNSKLRDAYHINNNINNIVGAH